MKKTSFELGQDGKDKLRTPTTCKIKDKLSERERCAEGRWKERKKERLTERERERQTEKERKRETDREREKERERDRQQ